MRCFRGGAPFTLDPTPRQRRATPNRFVGRLEDNQTLPERVGFVVLNSHLIVPIYNMRRPLRAKRYRVRHFFSEPVPQSQPPHPACRMGRVTSLRQARNLFAAVHQGRKGAGCGVRTIWHSGRKKEEDMLRVRAPHPVVRKTAVVKCRPDREEKASEPASFRVRRSGELPVHSCMASNDPETLHGVELAARDGGARPRSPSMIISQ